MKNYKIIEPKAETEKFRVFILGYDIKGGRSGEAAVYTTKEFEEKVLPALMKFEKFYIEQATEGIWDYESDDILPIFTGKYTLIKVSVTFEDKNGIEKDVDVDYSEVYNGLNSK